MHFMPRPFQEGQKPKDEDLCDTCALALNKAQDLASSVVYEVINDYTVRDTLAVDIRHQRPSSRDNWEVQFPTKTPWQHTISCFNSTRLEYYTYSSITVLYRKGRHIRQCDAAYIIMEMHRKTKAPEDIQDLSKNIVRKLILETR